MIEGLLFGMRESMSKTDVKAAYRGIFYSPAGRVVLADITGSIKRAPTPGQSAEERAFNDGEQALALRIVRTLIYTEEDNG